MQRSSLFRRPPLIGITGRQASASLIVAPPGFADAPIDIYFREYAQSVTLAGGIPVYVPLEIDPEAMVEKIDGLILAGGEDVDPRLYGQEPGEHTGTSDPMRDAVEIALIHAARKQNVPILGVCRGQQLINVAYGGSLIQHLEPAAGEPHMAEQMNRTTHVHEVAFAPGSIARRLYGSTTSVNTFHHQAIDRSGEGVQATGWAPDGTIEAIEIPGSQIVAVQWHPECFGGDPMFEWLVRQARTGTIDAETPLKETTNSTVTLIHADLERK